MRMIRGLECLSYKNGLRVGIVQPEEKASGNSYSGFPFPIMDLSLHSLIKIPSLKLQR